MDIKLLFKLGLYLCCIITISNCQQIEIGSGSDDQEAGSSIDIPTAISGSGDLPDTQGGDDEDILIVPGSGAGETTTRKATTVAVSTNPDDEGGDDDNEIIIMEGSGPVDGSGDDTTFVPEGTMSSMPENMECSSNFLYCWCKNEQGLEIPGSRYYQGDAQFLQVDCTALLTNREWTTEPIAPLEVTEVTETVRPIIVEEETTAAAVPTTKQPTTQRRRTTVQPPYEVDQVSTKFGKPADVTEPQEGVGSDGVFRGDDVDKEPVDVMRPLFSHPGILAAVIGGGVVALLCALLLIMFVVYRMRKKDEGSYPLDPDSKPPRLHTYTRAPNKEFYA